MRSARSGLGIARRALAGPIAAEPRPLLDPDNGLMVVWSAKCASMTTVVWFLKIVGLIRPFRASRLSPHRYGRLHYQRSELYARGLARLVDDYTILQIIRDPYSRAVSSYRHALGTGYADRDLAAFAPERLDRFEGFSFAHYLDFLETLDLDRADPHHRPQRHPIHALKPPDRVINIARQNLFRELNRIENERGLPRTRFESMPWLERFERIRKPILTVDTRADAADIRLDHDAARGLAPWPAADRFLTAATRRRIEALYAADFEAFAAYL